MILVGVSTQAGRVDRACEALAKADPKCIHVASKDEACREVETGVSTAPGAT